MLIDYFQQKKFTETLDLAEPGCVGLICDGADGTTHYLATKTVMGVTSIVTAGPVVVDIPELFLDGFSVSFTKIKWSEAKLAKNIASFLNDPKRGIYRVEVVPESAVIAELPDLSIIFDNL